MEKDADTNPDPAAPEKSSVAVAAAAARAALLSSRIRTPDAPCPDDEDFALFLSARLDADKREDFLTHMDDCPACRQQLLHVRSALEYASTGQDESIEEAAASRPGARQLWKKAAFAFAAAACLLLFFSHGRFMPGAKDELGELTAELASLPKTRGSISPWLDTSRKAEAADKTRLVYEGYAYEAALMKNRGKADAPAPPAARDALPYHGAGRLLFAAEQFCKTEGEIGQKQWERLRAYWEGRNLEKAFSDVQAIFVENTPPSCLRLREAMGSAFGGPQ
ncbi:MAG: hypothetical protein LBQ51_10135 [Desulfovibrio sp.]|jgi:hypothetical protein|nr:hypothetical protein [Desulfovibrio sp.]